MPVDSCLFLVLLLPLAVFVLLGLGGKGRFVNAAGPIATILLLVVTGLSLYAAGEYFFVFGKAGGIYRPALLFSFTWLQFTPSLAINMGLLLDPVAAMMIAVISFVSLMVHLFSLGYMKGDNRQGPYYAFLSLFTFSMLGLVLSANIFQLYFFWELVGVSSYLLIGFYYQRGAAVAAAKKAFIVTRFADLGLLVGILIIAFSAGSLDFAVIISRLSDTGSSWARAASGTGFLGLSVLTWALVLVFAGGAGKSAMFPLHIWLPDAMEGPTPVSALIHAATMVVAGVFLVARLFPVFVTDAAALGVVAYTGAITAVLAAIMACVQQDIKRVLAYSTMSQIGYMMLALGVAGRGGEGLGFMAAMFHLFTHAFFKSLLFLGAGAIIHFVHSNNMQDMGGLRKQMPVTHTCFLIACLAISGIPPLAGFFSKEEILAAAWEGNRVIYWAGLLVSGFTAFYMFRLYFSIFWNREDANHHHQPEAAVTMKLPMLILAVITVFAGFAPFSRFVTADGVPLAAHIDFIFSIAPVALACAGIGLAAYYYGRPGDRPVRAARAFGAIYRVALHKFYIDEAYLFITRTVVFKGIGRPSAWFDRKAVDGMINYTAKGIRAFSGRVKGWQSGRLQHYALYFIAGVGGLILLLWLTGLR